MKNKKRTLVKLLSLALAAALLAGVLLVTASAAEFDLPQMPDWGVPTGDSFDAMYNNFRTVVQWTNAVDLNEFPVFFLELTDGSTTETHTAFYAQDPANGNTYLLSFANAGEMIEEYGLSCSLKTLKGNGSVEYLGRDGAFSYFSSEVVSGYTPLLLGNTASNTVTMLLLLPDESGKPESIKAFEADLSKWKSLGDNVFQYTDTGAFPKQFNGMPVISAVDGTVIGVTFTTGYWHTARFGGTKFTFAQEYALPFDLGGEDSSQEPAGPGGSGEPAEPDQPGEPGEPTEPDNPDKPDKPVKPKNSTTLYLIIGAVAVAAFLFYTYKKKDEKKSEQSKEGSISLDPSGKQDKGEPGSPLAGQDIYGPTVPNPSAPKAQKPTVPVPEKGTVPLALWQLRGVEGPLRGKVYPLNDSLTIGRGAQCGVRFSQDAPGISGTHCQVTVKGDKVYLQDLGSSYGTFYPQNNRLDPKTDCLLHEGGVFALAQGGGAFRLEKAGAAAAADAGRIVIKDMNGKTYHSDASMRITLGRNSGCQGGFGSDESSVSGRHCELYREGGKLYLKDLDSTNGTFFSQQERLKPNVPYRIRKGMAFFLTTPKYTFVVVEE